MQCRVVDPEQTCFQILEVQYSFATKVLLVHRTLLLQC